MKHDPVEDSYEKEWEDMKKRMETKKKRRTIAGTERNRAPLWGMVWIAILLLTGSCAAVSAAQNDQTEPLKIAVASDLHIDPENLYAGVVNPLVLYNMDVVDALLYDVAEQQADLLLLCGDITNSGRDNQHAALVEKLKAAKENGLPIYVLPGNHDIGQDQAELFSTNYADFGFHDADSRDTDSLSYSIRMEEFLILMLDTDGYSRRTNGAYVSEQTLGWVEEQLQMAEKEQLQVLVAGHYSLLTGQTTEFQNQDRLIALLEKYQIPLYLCGHLHGRNVTTDGRLTELVVEQVTAYPCGYGILYTESTDEYRYSPRRIDVSAWAQATGQTSPALLDFNSYQEKVFRQRCTETMQLLAEAGHFSAKKVEQAADFFWRVQVEYIEGTLSAHIDELLKSPEYKAFMKIAGDSNYGKWIPSYLEKANPYTAGFLLKDHKLRKQ